MKLDQTIDEAKVYLRKNWHENKGVACPCCNQRVKLYKTPLSTGMAAVLIKFYKAHKKTPWRWVHPITEFKTVNGDYAKLRFWGLIEEKGDAPSPEKKASGYWRITQKGVIFATNRGEVPKRKYIFDNKTYGESDEFVNIKQCLKTKFNYDELMKL